MTDAAENIDHVHTGSGGDLIAMLEPIRFDFSKAGKCFFSRRLKFEPSIL